MFRPLTFFAAAWLATSAPAGAADAALVPGVWAFGAAPEACAKAPVSVYFADGSTVVFESATGALHAVGTWRIADDQLHLTHNDAPFAQDGASKPATVSTIAELSATRFVTRTPEGKTRERVRCTGLTLPFGAKAAAH
jgi:hypothetical protein